MLRWRHRILVIAALIAAIAIGAAGWRWDGGARAPSRIAEGWSWDSAQVDEGWSWDA